MKTLKPSNIELPNARLVVSTLAAAFFLAACGGDGSTPEALPLVDEVETATTSSVLEDTASTVAPTTTTTTIATTTSTTTTEAPLLAPLVPTLVVECATNPPTVTVAFDDTPGTAIDWELRVTRHPGGTGLEAIVDVLDSGAEPPAGPVTHDIAPNDLGFVVESTNESGTEQTGVSVERYSSCPVSGSLEGRIVDQIDCVSGAFRFAPTESSAITVNSVVIDRVSGSDATLSVNASGTYWVPGWSGPEEVKAVVTFSDTLGTYEEHINHWCFGGPFMGLDGNYKVCADDAVKIAYPGEWVSTIDLDGPEGNSCEFFRYGPEDGHVDHNVTLEKLGAMTLDEATDVLLPPGPWIIADEEPWNPGAFSDRIGTTAGGERIRFELAWDTAPTLSRRVVWLFDVDGTVWRLETNIQGLREIDGMANSVQFIVQ